MGVPKLWANIIKNFPGILIDKKKISVVDNLYIDFNALVYNALRLVTKNERSFQDELIEQTIGCMVSLINSVGPKERVYVAIDGPAPAAKMHQQRDRRYKNIIPQKMTAEVAEIVYGPDKAKEYTKNVSSVTWSTSNISPGTIFMEKLEKRVLQELETLKNKRGLKYIFNGSSVPGEGEHKIINYIKSLGPNEQIHVIDSPDNDLIILLISIPMRLYLLRIDEDKNTQKIVSLPTRYIYLDIQAFLTKMYSEYNTSNEIEIYRFAEDYKFLSFMFGNDFVKPIPYLKIKENNTKTLIDAYITVQNDKDTIDKYLVHVVPNKEPELNLQFLEKLIGIVASTEQDLLKNIQRSMNRIRKFVHKEEHQENNKDVIFENTLNNMEHSPFYDKRNPFLSKYNYLFSKIDYYSDNYMFQYNCFFFKGIDMKDVLNQYIRSLKYTLNYYNGYVDQRYYYPYRAAPLLSNFASMGNFCKEQIERTELSQGIPLNLIFDYESRPVSQFEQLLIILPPKMRSLLPEYISRDMPKKLRNMYKKTETNDIVLDAVQGIKYIYSPLILNDLPTEEVIEYMKNVTTKEIDSCRNSVGSIIESS